MAKIIAISNQKGGVAKTTTTGAMAAGLKRKGYRVLTVDFDPQGNLSDSVGAETLESQTMYDLVSKKTGAEKVFDTIQHLEPFDILPTNIMLAGAEVELMSQSGREYRLKEVLEPVLSQYDYILIDTPPSLGILTSNAFTAADEVIIPTTAGIFATQGISQLNDIVEGIKKYNNPGVKIRGILITRYNPRTIINQDIKELTESLAEHIQAPIFDTYIRNSVVVEEAQANKKDIFTYKENSTVSEDYRDFVDEFLKGEKIA